MITGSGFLGTPPLSDFATGFFCGMVGEEKGGLPNERDVDNHIVVELKGGDPILRQV